MIRKFIVYVDGAASNNQDAEKRKAAYCACIFTKYNTPGKGPEIYKKDVTGVLPGASNNQAELYGVIAALRAIKEVLRNGETAEVEIRSDSQYVVTGASQWLENWKKNNWKSSKGKPIENQHLWKQLDELLNEMNVSFTKVAAHSSDKWNQYCDKVATNLCGSKGR